MSSVEEKLFLRLIKFSYDLSLKVTRTFTKTNILHQYNNSFVQFLDVFKHDLYHLWNNNIRCCACSSNSMLKQNRELNKEQFIKLYDIQGPITHGHFKRGKCQSVLQHCLCGITCIASCSLNDLDIILIHTIIRKCTKLSPDDDMWLETIREIRNNLAHAVSTTCFDQGRLEKWWFKLEGSVLGLAGKVPLDSYAELVEDQIELLKIVDFDRNAVQKFLSQMKEENKKMYEDMKTELEKISFENNQKVEQEHVGTRNQICQSNKELIKKLEDQEESIVCRIFKELDTVGFKRKDTQLVEASCQVNLDNIDEELVLNNIQQQEQVQTNSDFSITSAKRKCIILELSATNGIFQSTETAHQAIRSLIARIVKAGEIDRNVPYSIHIDITFKTHLSQDQLRIISSLSTLQLNTSSEQDRLYGQSRSDIICDLCQSQNTYIAASRWCPDCNITLCIACTTGHSSKQATQDHHTVGLHSKYDVQFEMERLNNCTEHSRFKVEYYCPVHDFICCSTCIDDNHKSCKDVVNLDVASKSEDRSIWEELGEEMNTIKESLECLEGEISTNISDINTGCQNIASRIADVKSKVIDQIHQNEQTLLLEMQEEKIKTTTEQLEVHKKCQNFSEKLVLCSSAMRFIKQHGTEKQAFILAHNLQQTIKKTDDSVATLISTIAPVKIAFDERQELIPSVQMLGRIYKSEKPSQTELTAIKQKNAQCIVQAVDKPSLSFNLTSTFRTSEFAYITGMVVTEDNKLLLCNYNKHGIIVYSDNGQYICTLVIKDRPYDLAVIPGGDQYGVTLPNISSIQYINKDLTPGRSVRLPSESLTYGIAADKQYIYVGEYNRIFVLNHTGSVVREIMLDDCGMVYYLAVNDNELCAIGWSSHIYFIDHNKIKQTEVIGAGRIGKIIIDRQGYIYVGGQGSGKVHRLAKELKETMAFGDDIVENITAICFNKDCTRLFVASEGGETIAIFSCF